MIRAGHVIRLICKCTLLIAMVTACTPVRPWPEATPTPSVLSDEELASQLDTFMRGQEENLSFSGAALVSREGKVLLSNGYGYSDRQNKLSNTE